MCELPSKQAEDIFCSAVEIMSASQRNCFLDRACEGDAGLRAAVDELLASNPDAEKFFREYEAYLVSGKLFEPLSME
jgi:hypothetical protein